MSDKFGIGRAVEELKQGNHVARHGWNGKGMWLVYQMGRSNVTVPNCFAEQLGVPAGTPLSFSPYVVMRIATGELIPWNCSQADLLAEDWTVVPR